MPTAHLSDGQKFICVASLFIIPGKFLNPVEGQITSTGNFHLLKYADLNQTQASHQNPGRPVLTGVHLVSSPHHGDLEEAAHALRWMCLHRFLRVGLRLADSSVPRLRLDSCWGLLGSGRPASLRFLRETIMGLSILHRGNA